ncbi:DUF805 domain-containing protein [uncultured Microbacterium sp.]|uniref:DUF805 domain-containing protein n=1 Tax=uncultured Microbacterium sp. TaxID=191216 RepID=UPI0025EFEE6F|nr:DUF805 domain-containing protein [uncultured Microbacterium sp.]
MSNTNTRAALEQPYYGAPIGAAVQRFFKKYATFTGRASRSEYWWWVLVNAVVLAVLGTLALVTGGGGGVDEYGAPAGPSGLGVVFLVLYVVWGLATLVPGIALVVRRLHDTNKSGFWIFIGLVPFVGSLILLVFMLLPPVPEGARFDA